MVEHAGRRTQRAKWPATTGDRRIDGMHVGGCTRPLLDSVRATNVIRVGMRQDYVSQILRLQRAAACDDCRIPNLIEIIERAIQANVHLLRFRIDRSRWRYRILANQCIADISCADSQRSEPLVGELDKNPFWPLSNDVDLLHSRHLKNPLPKRLCFTRKLPRRKAWSLDRVERERHIGVFIIDERTEDALRQLVCFVA